MSTYSDSGLATYIAGAALEAHRRVRLQSGSTTTVVYANKGEESIGITRDRVDSGARVAVALKGTPGAKKVTAAGAFSAGANVYGADSGQVDDVVTGRGDRYLASAAATAAGDVVRALPLPAAATELLESLEADGATLTNSTVETALASKTIAGEALQAGDVLEVLAQVTCPSTNATDTLNLQLKLGTEVIVATGGVDVANGDVGLIHAFIQIRAAGAAGTLQAAGTQGLGVPGTVTAKPFRKDQAAEDLSADVAISLTGTWSVANAANQAHAEVFLVKHHRKS